MLTPLYSWHAAHDARFVEQDGWQLPAVYSTVESESTTLRTAVGLADISAFAKISLLGRGVSSIARSLLAGDPSLEPSDVALLSLESPTLACRLTRDHLLLLASTPSPDALKLHLAGLLPGQAVVSNDVTSACAGLCLAGPHTENVLSRLTSLDIAVGLLPGSCAETNLAGVHALLVHFGQFSLLAVRVYVAWDLAEYVWQRMLEAGQEWHLAPVGLEALRSLHAQSPFTTHHDTFGSA